LPGDRVGALASWSFPEVVYEGVADAAIFTYETEAFASVVDIGATTGTARARDLMQVTKRGRTSGQTWGRVSAIDGGPYKTDYLPSGTLRLSNGAWSTRSRYTSTFLRQ
jgi:hypothetical protein